MITNTDRDKPLSRLLVVDDDPDNAQVLKLSLVNYGFLVDAFSNPKEALQKFKSNPHGYRLVLTDNWMPELSGIQLARNVKEANPNVKVLLLTGSEKIDNEASDVSPSNSVDGFVQKPIVIRKLTDKILSLIGEAESRSNFKGQIGNQNLFNRSFQELDYKRKCICKQIEAIRNFADTLHNLCDTLEEDRRQPSDLVVK